jgi:hypothetical protein
MVMKKLLVLGAVVALVAVAVVRALRILDEHDANAVMPPP